MSLEVVMSTHKRVLRSKSGMDRYGVHQSEKYPKRI